ncbi:hypothetical protein MANES_12G114433v8 [Manihot esculenta]|uniref:Uncharacterized protein n=1 Tax=Manihot esculenta TaxID=3983 RepID=A0ACB7GRY6_MANES|nr:hypothetical protein MANES_12G114433v8 [Manihot esculenta]
MSKNCRKQLILLCGKIWLEMDSYPDYHRQFHVDPHLSAYLHPHL